MGLLSQEHGDTAPWLQPGRLRLFLFRLGSFRRLVHDEGLEPGKLLLEPGNEVARAVFEQDDKAKREEQKKGDPKNAA